MTDLERLATGVRDRQRAAVSRALGDGNLEIDSKRARDGVRQRHSGGHGTLPAASGDRVENDRGAHFALYSKRE